LIRKGKKQLKKSNDLLFEFDNANNVNHNILELIGISATLLRSKSGELTSYFKKFRLEKNVIKALKFKAEGIKFDSK